MRRISAEMDQIIGYHWNGAIMGQTHCSVKEAVSAFNSYNGLFYVTLLGDGVQRNSKCVFVVFFLECIQCPYLDR